MHENLSQYAREEGIDPWQLSRGIAEMPKEPVLPSIQEMSLLLDKAIPDLWWAGVDRVAKLKGNDTSVAPEATLAEQMYQIRTREDTEIFYGETLTPISHSSLRMLRDHLRENPNQNAQRLVPLVEAHLQASEHQISGLLDSIARIRLSGIALHALFPLVSHPDPDFKIAAAGTALPLATYHAHVIANAYDAMNHQLREGIHNGAVLESHALRALGVPISETMSRFTSRMERVENLLRLYPAVITPHTNGNAEIGFAIGGAVASSLIGTINPFLYGIVGNRVQKLFSNLANRFHNAGNTEQNGFVTWFNGAQKEVTDLAEKAAYSKDPESFMELITVKSREMQRYIKSHSNLPQNFSLHRYQWAVQFMSQLLSSPSAHLLFGGAIATTIGLEPIFAMTKMNTDQAAIKAQQVPGNQAYHTLKEAHNEDARLYDKVGSRFKEIADIASGIDLQRLKNEGKLFVDRLVLKNGTEMDAQIRIKAGYNFFSGDSGSGKSSVIEQLMTTCDIHDVPYSYSPVHMLEHMSSGLFITQTVSETKRPFYNSHFGEYVRKKSNITESDFDTGIEKWRNEWIQIAAKKTRDTPAFNDPRWSDESSQLNDLLVRYLKEVYHISDADKVIFNNGSEGERKRLEIAGSLQNNESQLIFVDESFANLDPALATALITLFHSVLLERTIKPSVVIVSHQPQTIHQFIRSNAAKSIGNVSITRFKKESAPITQDFEENDVSLFKVIDHLEGFISLAVQSDIMGILQIFNNSDDLDGEALKHAIQDETIIFQEAYSNLSETDKSALQPFLTQATLQFIDKLLDIPLTMQQRYMIFIAFEVEVLDPLIIDNSEVTSLVECVRKFFPDVEYDYMDNEVIMARTDFEDVPKNELDIQRILEEVEYFRAGTLHRHAGHIIDMINDRSDPEFEDKLLESVEFLALYYHPGETTFAVVLNNIVNAVITGNISDTLRSEILFTISATLRENFEDNISEEIQIILKRLSSVLPITTNDWSTEPVSYQLPEQSN
ncbi:hypothetical protein COU87_03090 [Candidatus Roizmanbacteria bacterium CG10_big_fil_rev_8_21_14_0_10_39_12]|uniref:Uncharacterized protein n=1 Tax=Candidatus Roizmanbacteria bacterium CG10_big_fil_rev_8_21_14_0_10_39_12 TaxID=1974852 RepID=A0A2M8KP71_9BACT|nr:MAG: hypothetical protein COU87_03090 [Candidatus Roizmanbacteria bacterium CG10_big_fil_rev_8_21_14_0_10_39_12]